MGRKIHTTKGDWRGLTVVSRQTHGHDAWSIQEISEQNDDGSWDITGLDYWGKDKLQHTELSQNRMTDIMMLYELNRTSENISVQALTKQHASEEDHILTFYKQELESGRYRPTIMISRKLNKPQERGMNDITITIKDDSDILSKIKEDSLSNLEKIKNMEHLEYFSAAQNNAGTWDVFAHKLTTSAAFETNVSQEQAMGIIREIEVLRGVADMDLPKNMLHHPTQVRKLNTQAAARENAANASIPSEPKSYYSSEDIQTDRGGKFKYNLN